MGLALLCLAVVWEWIMDGVAAGKKVRERFQLKLWVHRTIAGFKGHPRRA